MALKVRHIFVRFRLQSGQWKTHPFSPKALRGSSTLGSCWQHWWNRLPGTNWTSLMSLIPLSETGMRMLCLRMLSSCHGICNLDQFDFRCVLGDRITTHLVKQLLRRLGINQCFQFSSEESAFRRRLEVNQTTKSYIYSIAGYVWVDRQDRDWQLSRLILISKGFRTPSRKVATKIT